MRKIQFTSDALSQFYSYKNGQQKIAFRIFELLQDMQQNPFEGLGKPEALKYGYTKYWSRRITDEHRLIYEVKADVIEIISCKGHYTE